MSRRHRRRHSRLDSTASWLDRSPVAKVAIAGAAILAFLLSTANGLWSLAREFEANRRKPGISIGGRTSYSLQAFIRPSQIFGDTHFPSEQGRSREVERPWKLPYYPVQLHASNPTNQPTSITGCELKITFFQRTGFHTSLAYIDEASFERDPSAKANPVLRLDPGELERVDLLFFFLPTPELQAVLEDRTIQAYMFQVTCRDESGASIQTPAPQVPT